MFSRLSKERGNRYALYVGGTWKDSRLSFSSTMYCPADHTHGLGSTHRASTHLSLRYPPLARLIARQQRQFRRRVIRLADVNRLPVPSLDVLYQRFRPMMFPAITGVV